MSEIPDPIWGVDIETMPIRIVPNRTEPLVSPRDLSVVLGVLVRTITDWPDAGCPFYDIEGLVRFRKSEVRRWMKRTGRASGESNPAIGLRRPKSGSTGKPERDRREYMRAYQAKWIAKRRADFFADKACIECGATEGLQLHHREPGDKVAHNAGPRKLRRPFFALSSAKSRFPRTERGRCEGARSIPHFAGEPRFAKGVRA